MDAHNNFRKETKKLITFYKLTLSCYQKTSSLQDARKRKLGIARKTIRDYTESTLRELILVRAISAIETFLADAIKEIYLNTKTPFMDSKSTVSISHAELLNNNSPSQIYQRVIDQETRKLTSGGFSDFAKYFRSKFKIDLANIHPGISAMCEYHDRRNLLVHRLGKTDESYRKKYKCSDKKISVTGEYLDEFLVDIISFSESVKKLMEAFLGAHKFKDKQLNARLIVDIQFLKGEPPAFLKPDYQFWVEDKYIVMSDIIIKTSPQVNNKIRYFLDSDDHTLTLIKKKLRKEQKAQALSTIYVTNDSRKRMKKELPTEAELMRIKEAIPIQPWPTGIHEIVATTLNVSNRKVYQAITILIHRGHFKPQLNGEIIGQ